VFEFEIKSNCSNTEARTGIFHTPNGQVNTPRFMPVGTLATVKGISSKQLISTGSGNDSFKYLPSSSATWRKTS
jgi:queuine tRNA-ribosyltransferase